MPQSTRLALRIVGQLRLQCGQFRRNRARNPLIPVRRRRQRPNERASECRQRQDRPGDAEMLCRPLQPIRELCRRVAIGRHACRLQPRRHVRWRNWRLEIFPRQRISPAKIATPPCQLQSQHIAIKTTAPVITRRNDRTFGQFAHALRQFCRRHRPDRQVDGARHVPALELAGVAHIDQDRALCLDQAFDRLRIKQRRLVGIGSDRAQIGQRSRSRA